MGTPPTDGFYHPATSLRRSRRRAHARWAHSGKKPLEALAVGLTCLAAAFGCGTNLNDLLLQSSNAVGRTYLDMLLSDLANTLAGTSGAPEPPPADGNQDGDGNGGNGTNDGNGPPPADGFDDLTGDAGAGETIYANNGCAGCHCADASGGCLATAPGLVGVDAETLDDFLRGDAPHPTSADLSNQEIVDLEAYLASL